jgi:hypothetical protein
VAVFVRLRLDQDAELVAQFVNRDAFLANNSYQPAKQAVTRGSKFTSNVNQEIALGENPCKSANFERTSDGEPIMESSDNLNVTRRELLIGATSVGATTIPLPAYGQTVTAAAPAIFKVFFDVNGKGVELELDTRTTLLDALREHLHLTGTKKGCDHGQCGACTVIAGGVASIHAWRLR